MLRFFQRGILVGCLMMAGAAWAQPEEEAASRLKWPKLFGSVEFRASLKGLPNWMRIVEQGAKQVAGMNACRTLETDCSSAALSWQQALAEAGDRPPMEQLQRINAFFNRWPYRLDQDVYRRSDYWALPLEFLRKSGDCEDFSIVKYFALRELGFSSGQLRIVVLKDNIRGVAHAVLAVYLDGEVYVLDNLSDLVFSHAMYEHYVPQYSVNESSRWAHVRARAEGG